MPFVTLGIPSHDNLAGVSTADHHTLYTDAEALAAVEAAAEITIQGQITFPAVQSASAGANVLDDYEEGAWIPQIADNNLDGDGESQTYTAQIGTYTKVGNRVHCQGELRVNSIGSLTGGEQVRILGLPFALVNTGSFRGSIAIGTMSSLAVAAQDAPHGFVEPNTAIVVMENWDAVGPATAMSITEWSAGGAISFTISYEVG